MNSAHISMCQKDVRPSVQKRWRTMTFSRVSTGDSFIPSSCEMKYEPAFKPLQGNPAFFWVKASRGPFHLRQKTQIPSHIPISEGRLLLRCLWKVGLPLQSKTGNHSHSQMIWGARNIPQLHYWNWWSSIIEKVVSGNLSRFLKRVKPLVLYDVDRPVVMESMQVKLASSQFDFGYTKEYYIPGVTSVFFSSCDSVFGDTLEFNQANRGSLRVWLGIPIALDTMQGNRASSRSERKVSWVFLSCGRNLGYILELRRRCTFETGVCSVKSGHLSRYEGQLRNVN